MQKETTQINRLITGGEPVYVQITNELKSEITSGQRNPGDLMPSESALMNRFSTSRETIRKSLKELEQKGLLYTRPGKGYFVAEPEHDLYSFYFHDEDKGYESKFRRIITETPIEEIRTALALPENQRVIKISRIITMHDDPVAYDEKYLPYNKGEPVIEAEIKYAVFPVLVKSPPFAFYTRMEIGSVNADKPLCGILKCEENESLMVMYRYCIGQDGTRLGYGKKYLTKKWGRLDATAGYRDI